MKICMDFCFWFIFKHTQHTHVHTVNPLEIALHWCSLSGVNASECMAHNNASSIYQHHWNSASVVTTCYDDNHIDKPYKTQSRERLKFIRSSERYVESNPKYTVFDSIRFSTWQWASVYKILVWGFHNMYIYIHFALEFVLVFFGSSCVASYIQRVREKQSKINKMNFVNKRKNMIDTAAEAIKQAKKRSNRKNMRSCQICWHSLIEPCKNINDSTIFQFRVKKPKLSG